MSSATDPNENQHDDERPLSEILGDHLNMGQKLNLMRVLLRQNIRADEDTINSEWGLQSAGWQDDDVRKLNVTFSSSYPQLPEDVLKILSRPPFGIPMPSQSKDHETFSLVVNSGTLKNLDFGRLKQDGIRYLHDECWEWNAEIPSKFVVIVRDPYGCIDFVPEDEKIWKMLAKLDEVTIQGVYPGHFGRNFQQSTTLDAEQKLRAGIAVPEQYKAARKRYKELLDEEDVLYISKKFRLNFRTWNRETAPMKLILGCLRASEKQQHEEWQKLAGSIDEVITDAQTSGDVPLTRSPTEIQTGQRGGKELAKQRKKDWIAQHGGLLRAESARALYENAPASGSLVGEDTSTRKDERRSKPDWSFKRGGRTVVHVELMSDDGNAVVHEVKAMRFVANLFGADPNGRALGICVLIRGDRSYTLFVGTKTFGCLRVYQSKWVAAFSQTFSVADLLLSLLVLDSARLGVFPSAIGRYTLLRCVGRGLDAVVFEAVRSDVPNGRTVAAKLFYEPEIFETVELNYEVLKANIRSSLMKCTPLPLESIQEDRLLVFPLYGRSAENATLEEWETLAKFVWELGEKQIFHLDISPNNILAGASGVMLDDWGSMSFGHVGQPVETLRTTKHFFPFEIYEAWGAVPAVDRNMFLRTLKYIRTLPEEREAFVSRLKTRQSITSKSASARTASGKDSWSGVEICLDGTRESFLARVRAIFYASSFDKTPETTVAVLLDGKKREREDGCVDERLAKKRRVQPAATEAEAEGATEEDVVMSEKYLYE